MKLSTRTGAICHVLCIGRDIAHAEFDHGESMQRMCAFTTCDRGYFPHAVVALTAIRKWMPKLDLVVITDSISDEDQALFERYKIKVEVTQVEGHFGTSWSYPRHCYYWFAGAEILHRLGYEKGVYLDADTLANGDLSDWIDATDTLGGVAVGPIKDILSNDIDKLESHFGPLPDSDRIQSGVVTMNFPALRQRQFLKAMSGLYDQCLSIGAPRKGDDSLLALALGRYPDLKPTILNPNFNIIEYDAMVEGSEEWHRVGEKWISRDGIFHFTARSKKPWDNPATFPTYRAKYFTKKWERHAVDTLHDHDLKRYFPELHKKLTRRHLRFYWYPAQNLGDQITPYLLSRTRTRTLPTSGIKEKEIRLIESKGRSRLSKFLSRVSLRRSSEKRASYIVSTGSVFRLCGNHALVFGSGIRSREQDVTEPQIRFVRGPITRERVLSVGSECPAIYGDPALCLPRIFNPSIEKEFELGIIPHFTEVEHVKRIWTLSEGVRVIDTNTDDIEAFLIELLKCRSTLSSSLHGLILSHAYGIPTRHVLLSDGIFGDGTKFRDHYAAVGVPHEPLDLRKSVPEKAELIDHATERMTSFDDRWLWDEMFLDLQGLKNSTLLPF